MKKLFAGLLFALVTATAAICFADEARQESDEQRTEQTEEERTQETEATE